MDLRPEVGNTLQCWRNRYCRVLSQIWCQYGYFYSWKKKYEHKGEAGLKVTYDTKSKELKQAEEENRILRKLLGDKEIELEVQRELLKKKFGTSDPIKI